MAVMQHKRLLIPASVLLLAGVLGACSQQAPEAPAPATPPQAATAADDNDPVIATVDGAQIRQSQLLVLMQRLSQDEESVDEATRKKMIESLVRIRAIAKEAEARLPADELQMVNAKAQAYREELLAQRYLAENVEPRPVTHAMVEAYYKENLDKFSEPDSVRFQTLSIAKEDLPEGKRARVLKAFGGAESNKDWQALAAGLTADGIAVDFKAAKMRSDQLTPEMAGRLQALEPGSVSEVIFGKKIMVIKLLERKSGTVKPLQAVSTEIRRSLAPQMVKEALAEASKEILSNAQVKYMNGG